MASFELGKPPGKRFEEACSGMCEPLGCLSWLWLEEHAGCMGEDAPGCRQKVPRKLSEAQKLGWAVMRVQAHRAMGPAYPHFCKGRSGRWLQAGWGGLG